MLKPIRNFCIIAHIDHGKSTLADRLLELTKTVAMRDMRAQHLDGMELERERGITIKAKAVRMEHNGYILNLIDTPGHVDFTYEVSRALNACEGALLIVDASQGVEAQTMANAQLAKDAGLKIIPVINKIDLPAAEPDRVHEEIIEMLGIEDDPLKISAKTGIGVETVLDAIINRVPPPVGKIEAPVSALLFDSVYDVYRGIIVFIRMVNGQLKKGERVRFMATGSEFTIEEIGTMKMKLVPSENGLSAGEVGYLILNIRDASLVHTGDTVTSVARPTTQQLPGYKEVKPFVFSGMFTINSSDYELLKAALEKLHLQDSSFQYEPETSVALGFGFRCGFLGLLHMDIIKQRLEREYDLSLIITAPNVVYRILDQKGELFEVENPSKFPDNHAEMIIEEPYVRATIITPSDYTGPIMQLAQDRRGNMVDMKYMTTTRVRLQYELPLAEIVVNFYDQLKSISKGYASFDYEPIGYKEGDLVKLEILVADEPLDALSYVVHKSNAYSWGRRIAEKMKELIPRQMFEVPIQARIEGRVIARETVSAIRKDVLAKCYGGDISRKRKLLEKQKEGKKRMKQFGAVEIPQEAFLAALKLSED